MGPRDLVRLTAVLLCVLALSATCTQQVKQKPRQHRLTGEWLPPVGPLTGPCPNQDACQETLEAMCAAADAGPLAKTVFIPFGECFGVCQVGGTIYFRCGDAALLTPEAIRDVQIRVKPDR